MQALCFCVQNAISIILESLENHKLRHYRLCVTKERKRLLALADWFISDTLIIQSIRCQQNERISDGSPRDKTIIEKVVLLDIAYVDDCGLYHAAFSAFCALSASKISFTV